MSKIIYKQRTRDPKTKRVYSGSANYAYVLYTATRPGVLLSAEGAGVFGKLNAEDALRDFADEKEVARFISGLRKKNTLLFRGYVSMKDETKEQIELTDLDAWKRFVEKSVPIIRDKNDIKAENFGYICSVHIKKDQPHFHISFWDRSSHNINHFVHPSKPDAIRKSLIRMAFENELEKLHQVQDISKSNIRGGGGAAPAVPLQSVSKRGRKAINKGIKELLPLLPKRGRLTYMLIPKDAKEKLASLCKTVIDHSDYLRSARERFIVSKLAEAGYFEENADQSKIIDYEKEIDKVLANAMLRYIKQNELSIPKTVYSRASAEGAVTALLNMLKAFLSASENRERGGNAYRRESLKNMSKEVMKLHISKLRESEGQIDWEAF
ncbi:hypothetical protein [Bacteroides heparinolyticus]|uniref:hypothetical protein n=1 Tax=Prevotella heparinolytica TaxID=28113 RepID=UPI00359F5424